MFDQMKQLASLMKNASAMREQAQKMKAELDKKTVEGQSGAGAVRVTMNGRGQVVRIHLDPPLITGLAGNDKAMVEDLIAAAVNDAHEKVQQLLAAEMQKLTGGMDLGALSNLMGG